MISLQSGAQHIVTRVDWENASNYNIHDTYNKLVFNMLSWDL